MKQSLTCLENKMKERTRREKEFWLIDISAFQNIDNASSMLNTLSLDVDDDIFLYMFIENDTASIWEMYKLAPEKDVIIRDFGSWTKEIGLKFTTLEKWQRRGDLYVSIFMFWKYFNISNKKIKNRRPSILYQSKYTCSRGLMLLWHVNPEISSKIS